MSKRQKTVFDRSELAHIWASQSQEYGKARTTQMSFRGPLLYSYSTGIGRLCKFKGKEYVLINIHSFGPTTSQHVGDARRAVSHMRIFSGDWGSFGADLILTPKEIVDYYRKEAEAIASKTSRYKHKQYKLYISAAHAYWEAIEAAAFFGMGTSKLYAARQKVLGLAEPLQGISEDYDSRHEERRNARWAAKRCRQMEWKDAKERNERELAAFLADYKVEDVPARWSVPPEMREEYDAQVKLREDWELDQKKEMMERWMKGDASVDVGELYDMPVRLRTSPPRSSEVLEIQTSKGAIIPYYDGKKAYRFACIMRKKGWRRNGEQFDVGRYQLDSITEEGVIAGCHRIPWDEVDRFAAQEGWIQSTEGGAS